MNSQLTFWQLVRLLRKPEMWRTHPEGFPDELITTDGRIRVYADCGTTFREGYGQRVLYEAGIFSITVIEPLTRALLWRVKDRERKLSEATR